MTGLPDGYFDDFYSGEADPWGFETRWYEQRKYALTLAMLPQQRYRRAFEPGCSIGVLTEYLSARCDDVLATDIAHKPLEVAAQRRLSNVTFEHSSLRDGFPQGPFDLIVLSEVCYYFTLAELPVLFASATALLDDGGTLIAVHWRHHVSDYPTSADEVQSALRATLGLTLLAAYQDEDVMIDVMIAGPSPIQSIAAREGLA